MTSTISSASPLLLGSQSPRRREILEGLGIPLIQRSAEINEDQEPGELLEAYLARVVEAKLRAVADLAPELGAAGVLAADTVVVVDEQILGKPRDEADALRLLQILAGREHRVLTRFALADVRNLAATPYARTVESRVTMRAASRDELERYARTGEGLDKAGAYAVQGCGAFLVERIDGSHSNVIGLPACEVVVELLHLGLIRAFPLAPGS